MVVHPAPGNESGTLVNAVMLSHPGSFRHRRRFAPGYRAPDRQDDFRPDRESTKNDAAHDALAEQIKSHSAGRIYLAIVDGNIREGFRHGERADRRQSDGPQNACCSAGRRERSVTQLARAGTLWSVYAHLRRGWKPRPHAFKMPGAYGIPEAPCFRGCRYMVRKKNRLGLDGQAFACRSG